MSESKKIAQLRDRLANIENNSTQPLSELSLPPGAAALATKIGTKALDLGADAVQGVKKFFTKPPPTLSQTSKFTLNGVDYVSEPGIGGNGIKWFYMGAHGAKVPVTDARIISRLEKEAAKHSSNLVQGASKAGEMWNSIKSMIPQAKKSQEAQDAANAIKSVWTKRINTLGMATVGVTVVSLYRDYENGADIFTDDEHSSQRLMALAGAAGLMWPPKTLKGYAIFIAAILLVGSKGLISATETKFTPEQEDEILKIATGVYRSGKAPNKTELDRINPNYYAQVKRIVDQWREQEGNSDTRPPSADSAQSSPLPAAPATGTPSTNNRVEIDALRKELGL